MTEASIKLTDKDGDDPDIRIWMKRVIIVVAITHKSRASERRRVVVAAHVPLLRFADG